MTLTFWGQAALLRERERRRRAERALRSSASSRASQEKRPPARRRSRSPQRSEAGWGGPPRGNPSSRPRPKKARSGGAQRGPADEASGSGDGGGGILHPHPNPWHALEDAGLAARVAAAEAALADATALLTEERRLTGRRDRPGLGDFEVCDVWGLGTSM